MPTYLESELLPHSQERDFASDAWLDSGQAMLLLTVGR